MFFKFDYDGSEASTCAQSAKRGDSYGSEEVLFMSIWLQILLILALNYEIFSKKIKGCYFDIDGSERNETIVSNYKPWQTGAFGAQAVDILDLTARRSLSPLRAFEDFARISYLQIADGERESVLFAAILYKF